MKKQKKNQSVSNATAEDMIYRGNIINLPNTIIATTILIHFLEELTITLKIKQRDEQVGRAIAIAESMKTLKEYIEDEKETINDEAITKNYCKIIEPTFIIDDTRPENATACCDDVIKMLYASVIWEGREKKDE